MISGYCFSNNFNGAPSRSLSEWIFVIQSQDASVLGQIGHGNNARRKLDECKSRTLEQFITTNYDGREDREVYKNVLAVTEALLMCGVRPTNWPIFQITISGMIPLLKRCGFNLDAQEQESGNTLLMIASQGWANVVHTLLNYGVDTTLRDTLGRTALRRTVSDQMSIFTLNRQNMCLNLIADYTQNRRDYMQPILETVFSSDAAHAIAEFVV